MQEEKETNGDEIWGNKRNVGWYFVPKFTLHLQGLSKEDNEEE